MLLIWYKDGLNYNKCSCPLGEHASQLMVSEALQQTTLDSSCPLLIQYAPQGFRELLKLVSRAQIITLFLIGVKTFES